MSKNFVVIQSKQMDMNSLKSSPEQIWTADPYIISVVL